MENKQTGSLDRSFIEDQAFQAELDQFVAERDKKNIEVLNRIEKEIKEHPLYGQLPGKEFTGLYDKAVQLAGFNPATLFEEPNLYNAADQIKFLGYAIALQCIKEWIDGEYRVGRQEKISPEILTKMQKYNLAGASSHSESFKADNKEANISRKLEEVADIYPIQVTDGASALGRIIPGHVQNEGINDHSCAGEHCYCPAGQRHKDVLGTAE